jgi:hypothetical protein
MKLVVGVRVEGYHASAAPLRATARPSVQRQRLEHIPIARDQSG